MSTTRHAPIISDTELRDVAEAARAHERSVLRRVVGLPVRGRVARDIVKRKLRPRAPITPTPMSVSQLTVEPIVGIDGRRYLDLLREHPECARSRVGKLVVVELDDLRALLRSLTLQSSPHTESDVHDDAGLRCDEQPETADAVLAKLGLRRTA
ncbi:MAG: hypothetical protein FWD73_08210 [Polyangiaceae bacterium]|nr:hypothetical protein [Polyangiaceae bacterium]